LQTFRSVKSRPGSKGNGKIGWHEMVKGQLIFMGPREILTAQQRRSLQENLHKSQPLFLTLAPS